MANHHVFSRYNRQTYEIIGWLYIEKIQTQKKKLNGDILMRWSYVGAMPNHFTFFIYKNINRLSDLELIKLFEISSEKKINSLRTAVDIVAVNVAVYDRIFPRWN